MGDRHVIRQPLAWQRTLAEMKAHGARVMHSCTAMACGKSLVLEIDQLIARHGPDYTLWDRKDPCWACQRPAHYLAAPGPTTPYRPLASGPGAEAARKAWLKSFGFTRRDTLRIRAMAETVTANRAPAALNDLDVPFRVGACMAGDEGRTTGKILGHWAGRTLLWWPMNERERDLWARRPRGVRPVG